MVKKLLTDAELRSHWSLCRENTYCVAEGTIVTPSARDFLRENHIELIYVSEKGRAESMPVKKIPFKNNSPLYVIQETGEEISEKPEGLTHLYGNVLVSKLHPHISFRGKLDSLEAKVLLVQFRASQELPSMLDDLEDILRMLRRIMAASVKNEPLEPFKLFGLSSNELRQATHNVRQTLGIDHPVPCIKQGLLCLQLNELRTQVRETELSAIKAFTDEKGLCTRSDIIEYLNRISSGVYLLYCRVISGYYEVS